MKIEIIITTLLTLVLLTLAIPQCRVSVIGSGLSGVYTAYRLSTATDSPYESNQICLFEATENLGGRLLPVEDEHGHIFEMGIESFNTAKMPLFTELVDFLGLTTECAWEMRREGGLKRDVKGFFETYQREPLEGEDLGIKKGKDSASEEMPAGAEMTEGEKDVKGAQRTPWMEMPAGAEMTEGEKGEKIGEEMPAGVEMTDDRKTGEKTKRPEQQPAGLASETECREAVAKILFLRSKIIYTNETQAELPFNIRMTLEKIKRLPHIAFNTVMNEYISEEELETLKSETDVGARWERVANLISNIAQSSVEYKGIPIHKLDMRMVLVDALDLSNDEIEAAIYLSDRFPRLRELMSMNLELFVIQYLRDLAAGVGEERTIRSEKGLRTVIDTMAQTLEEAGVQIYLNSKLSNLHMTSEGTIIMHFTGIDSFVATERLFLALNKKNLLSLTSTDLLRRISLSASETLGGLMDRHILKGVVFYDRAWWRQYDLADTIYSDSGLSKIEFHDNPDCTEECHNYIRFEQWRGVHDLNFDIFNPIDVSTVLSEFSANGISADLDEDTSTASDLTETSNETSSQTTAETELINDEMIRERNFHKLRSTLILAHIHRKIMNIVMGVPGFSAGEIDLPSTLLLANWRNDGIYNFGTVPLPGTSYINRILATMEPIQGASIHLVNNDISEFTDWDHSLESSLITVERVLNQVLGMEKPEWYNEKIFNSVVDV